MDCLRLSVKNVNSTSRNFRERMTAAMNCACPDPHWNRGECYDCCVSWYTESKTIPHVFYRSISCQLMNSVQNLTFLLLIFLVVVNWEASLSKALTAIQLLSTKSSKRKVTSTVQCPSYCCPIPLIQHSSTWWWLVHYREWDTASTVTGAVRDLAMQVTQSILMELGYLTPGN